MKPCCIPAILVMVLLTGCNTDLYYWGRYEDVIHYAYAHAEDWDGSGLIRLMEGDRERALRAGKPLPPGWHAHLGLLYYSDGQPDRALEEFQAEKNQFPESSLFMDRLLGELPSKPESTRTNRPLGRRSGGAVASDNLADFKSP